MKVRARLLGWEKGWKGGKLVSFDAFHLSLFLRTLPYLSLLIVGEWSES